MESKKVRMAKGGTKKVRMAVRGIKRHDEFIVHCGVCGTKQQSLVVRAFCVTQVSSNQHEHQATAASNYISPAYPPLLYSTPPPLSPPLSPPSLPFCPLLTSLSSPPLFHTLFKYHLLSISSLWDKCSSWASSNSHSSRMGFLNFFKYQHIFIY